MSKPSRSFLGATRRIDDLDFPLTQIELEHGISAGIQLRSLIDGLVPVFEEHAARLELGIGLEAWDNNEYIEKVIIVAHRRVRLAMRNLQEEAQIQELERKNKRHTRR